MEDFAVLVAKRIKLGLIKTFTEERISATPPDILLAQAEKEGGDIALKIRQTIYGKKTVHAEFTYPLTWWDAVKLRFIPAWFRKRWCSATTRRVVLESTTYFPTIPVVGSEIRFEAITQPHLTDYTLTERVIVDVDDECG